MVVRTLTPDDETMLGDYFLGLSELTRIFFGPHPFDRETAAKLCREEDPTALRIVAVHDSSIVGYFILYLGLRGGTGKRLADLDESSVCTIAPSVADEWKGSGLAVQMMRFLMDTARRHGRTKMLLSGGVRARNGRGLAFYRKFGFEVAGEFETTIKNYDMMAEIPPEEKP